MPQRIWLSFLLMLLAPAVFASIDRGVLQFDTIRSQQAEIRAGIEASTGLYKDLPSSTRSELLAKQSLLFRLMEGKQSTNDLSEEQKMQVFNTLEWIEATVKNKEDERLVCERRQILGSTRKERVCKTAAQLRMEHEATRERMDRRNQQ
ncbi:MAG TPA: hypothetical protein VGD21_00315 [Lysobacter sp.]